MQRPTARLVLAASIAVLGAVGWSVVAGARDGRADLVGPAVTPSSSAAPPRRSAVPEGLPDVVRPPSAPGLPRPAAPIRIVIPSIGVDDPIVPVGLLPDGSMQLPGASAVGWFSPGPPPGGSHGSSVLAGHIDFAGGPGPFFHLPALAVGRDVEVGLADGTTLRYRVVERFQVVKGSLPRAELFRTGGPPILTLVTCGGAFDSTTRHYTDNIVVRAAPV